MSEQITKDTVHRIIGDRLELAVGKLEAADNLVEKIAAETAEQVAVIRVKIDAMYGNGSGKKGILDDIKEEQKSVREDLIDDRRKQASFRHEMRNEFDTLRAIRAAELKLTAEKVQQDENTRKNAHDWIKWVAGGISVVLWEIFKDQIKPHMFGH